MASQPANHFLKKGKQASTTTALAAWIQSTGSSPQYGSMRSRTTYRISHPVATAHEEDLDRQTALDLGLDKIDRQVIKLKEKIKERKRPDPDADPVPLKVSANGPARIRVKLRPESLPDAEAQLRRDEGKHFHLFLDEDSGEIQLVFRREDGSIAVIEPVVT